MAEYFEVSDADLDRAVDNRTGFDDYEEYVTDLICNPNAIEATTAEGMRLHAEIRDLSCPWVVPRRLTSPPGDGTAEQRGPSDAVGEEDVVGGEGGPGIVTIRPVLECWSPEDAPPSDASTEPLTYPAAGLACSLGPTAGTGELFERGSAEVVDQQGWVVSVELRADAEAVWNALASACFNVTATCPGLGPGQRGQIAIVLDDVIVSAPTVNQPVFGSAISISGGLSEAEADALADALNRDGRPDSADVGD